MQDCNITIRLLFFVVATIAFIALSKAEAKSLEEKKRIVASSIINTYESSFSGLDPVLQKHYALRKYRVFGDSSFFPVILSDLKLTIELLISDMQNFNDTAYIYQREKDLFSTLNPKTRKGRARRKLFNQNRKMLFYLNYLYNVNTLSDYMLNDTVTNNLLDSAVGYLHRVDYETFLTTSKTLRVYAPQAVNYVYYLQQLKVVDFRDKYLNLFQKIYHDSLDSRLTKREFRNKIYGLTHFIISASRYYQQPVDSIEYGWIFRYFDKNIKRIIKQTSADIRAEVGICYKLGLYKEHKPLSRCIKKTIKSFDKKHSMILSSRGNADISKGEHRNILAAMLLSWGDSLYEGPELSEFQKDILNFIETLDAQRK